MALITHIDPQQELINSTEGIYLVDAGAGTGKTYSIIKRYNKIIGNNTDPKDILLVTFTVNAAKQMKQKVIKSLSDKISINKLLEAPIMTFHSFCALVIRKYGTTSPSYLGLKNILPSDNDILEDKEFESEMFRKFFLTFSDKHRNEYGDLLFLLEKESDNILKIIKKLCSLGIFPENGKWSKDAVSKLTVDYKSYSNIFDELNKPALGKNSDEIYNKLRKKFSDVLKEKLYLDFDEEKVFDGKRVNPGMKDEIFTDERQGEYIEFLKDIYLEYIEFLLQRNLMNYEFMVMFAYLTLYKNKAVREKMQFEYVMIDEFQDTDEIQFKIIMLLCKNLNDKINLCVVGDWKQGIYGFRNTNIENITKFGDNLSLYKDELNEGEIRIDYNISDYKKIIFENNYRSSVKILEFSRETLFIRGSLTEEVDAEVININFAKPLAGKFDFGKLTDIGFYKAKDRTDEYMLVLRKISELVSNKKKFKIRVYDKSTGEISEERSVKYSDICILSRTKSFCLELQREAVKAGIPANYGGGLEIFSSEQGILVLAWLRLLSDEKDIQGWIPVLEKDEYSYSEINSFREKISEDEDRLITDIPETAAIFLQQLKSLKNNLIGIVEAILGKYNFNDDVGYKIISVINSWNKNNLISLSELIRIIDRSKNTESKIGSGQNTDAVLIQTIHASKGLEYPVVILSNVNEKNFPGNDRDSGIIFFNDISGIRSGKYFADKGNYHYKFNNWKSDLIKSLCKNRVYDEDRRLLYVAVTRAMQYLYFTAHSPSRFFTSLSEKSESEAVENFDHEIISSNIKPDKTGIKIKAPGKISRGRKFVSPHLLMEEIPEDKSEDEITNADELNTYDLLKNKRFEFGKIVHEAANKIASGVELNSDIKEINSIEKFIKGLNANELKAEIDFLFPKGDTVIRGTIDLLAFYDDRVEIIDYKTDKSRKYESKYKIQLGIYRDVIKEIYKEKNIICKLYYVRLDETVEIL